MKLEMIYLLCTLFSVVYSATDCPRKCTCFGSTVECSNVLKRIPGKIPKWAEELYLSENPNLVSSNGSLAFPTSLLEELPELQSLWLDEMELEEIPELGVLGSLKTLSLSGNAISRARPNWSSGLESLTKIVLSKNNFETFNLSDFAVSSSLENIHLGGNDISSFTSSTNYSLPSLTSLSLQKNKIDDQAFRNLSAMFADMPNLESLDLSANAIRQPEALDFQNLPHLTVLKLRRNKLQPLSDGVFYGLHSLHTLRLDNNENITEINNGWLFSQVALRVLSMSHNKIGFIKDQAFGTTRNLVVLNLNYNRLGCQSPEPSFKDLTNLKHLFLAHNCIANLNKDTFGVLPNLKILDLSYNRLQWSIEDDTGVFSGLDHLTSLNLANNKIETIHGKVFHPLASLKSLDLSGNHLKTLPQNPFKNMKSLSKLILRSSNFVCDCKLSWFPEWLSEKSFNSVKAKCGFPERLSGKSVYKLNKEDLNCEAPLQSVVIDYPTEAVLFGESMTISCTALSNGGNITFTWMKNRKVVEPYLVNTYMSVPSNKSSDTFQVVSEIVIDNITYSDAGLYVCIARNEYGPTYAPSEWIEVKRAPYFIERPADAEVRKGDVIEIKCHASGDPEPEIKINKVGGDFSAPREKRLLFTNNVYYIKPALPRDEGVYVCTSSNRYGVTNATAKIAVISAPNFTRPAFNQVATLGQSIALECQGSGRPQPRVSWFKDNRPVVEDHNHALVDNGQFLLLLKVTLSDVGPYRCELTNQLGTQRRDFNLTLRKEHFFPAITGLVVMVVVSCVVLTSFIWLLVIYRMKRRRRNPGNGATKPGPTSNDQPGEEMRNLTPLLHTSPRLEGLQVAPDSGSEHSSGKDSGVGGVGGVLDDPPVANGNLKGLSNSRNLSTIVPGDFHFQGPSLAPMSRGRTTSEAPRPSLSTFGIHRFENGKPGTNPQTYASLRRGSTSRLLPVPSPITPGMGMNSLPRHAYRSHSNLNHGHPKSMYNGYDGADRCASLSRARSRRASRPDTPPPTSVTDIEEGVNQRFDERQEPKVDFRFPSSTLDHPRRPYALSQPSTYFTFRAADRPPITKKGIQGAIPSHLMSAR